MSFHFPSISDDAETFALLPDWGAPIRQTTTYRTDILTSKTGLEQRSQRRRRPILAMEYEARLQDGNASRAIEAAVTASRKPLIVPWWPNGGRLRVGMASETSAELTANPIAYDYERATHVFIFSRGNGGEFRRLEAIDQAALTLVDEGSHTIFPAGSWVFPCFRATREKADQTLAMTNRADAATRVAFRTL